MNLILFDDVFRTIRLEGTDKRALHIRKVLRAEVGTLIFLGFVNGARARARVMELAGDGSVQLEVIGTESAPKCLPLTLLVGLPRPHTAKRILFQAASMGVGRIYFFEAERGEPSYAQSNLWLSEAWKEHLWLGVEQSFATCLPDVAVYPDLQTALSELFEISARVALDNYEATGGLGEVLSSKVPSCALALGAERGWSPGERAALRKNGWKIAHLGSRVLRVETAVTAAVAIAATQLRLWLSPTVTEL